MPFVPVKLKSNILQLSNFLPILRSRLIVPAGRTVERVRTRYFHRYYVQVLHISYTLNRLLYTYFMYIESLIDSSWLSTASATVTLAPRTIYSYGQANSFWKVQITLVRPLLLCQFWNWINHFISLASTHIRQTSLFGDSCPFNVCFPVHSSFNDWTLFSPPQMSPPVFVEDSWRSKFFHSYSLSEMLSK